MHKTKHVRDAEADGNNREEEIVGEWVMSVVDGKERGQQQQN